MRASSVLLLAALALAGCTEFDFGGETGPAFCSPSVERVPCSAGMKVGVEYDYRLFTHCGVLSAYFDGRLWRASPPLDDRFGNPPDGWDNPSEVGTVELVARDRAEFRSRAGKAARFVPLPPGKPDPARGCA